MMLFIKMLQTGIVWLTAASTLVVSVPHFDCVCPNGNHKPFCLGISSSPTGCCCGGSCCSGASGGGCCCTGTEPAAKQEAAVPACCQKKTQKADKPVQVTSKTCTKSLAQPEDGTASSPRVSVSEETTPTAFLHPQAPMACNFLVHVPGQSGWHINLVPPPTDLVIALQHFLI